MLSIDLETHLVQPGLLTPPIVCVTWATEKDQGILDRSLGLDFIEHILRGTEQIAGAHIVYDFGCAAAARPHLLPLIFKAYDDGRVFDVLIAQALIDLYDGMLFKDPTTFREFNRYSLGLCTERHLGRAAKGKTRLDGDVTTETVAAGAGTNDEYRLRYATLEGTPIPEWPPEARDYAIGDARDTYDIAVLQQRIGQNLNQMVEQSRAAWALHLASVWGIRTDPIRVPKLTAEVERKHLEAQETFKACGIYREDGRKDSKRLMELVAKAYGGFYCPDCSGYGFVTVKAHGRGVNRVPESRNECGACKGKGKDDRDLPKTEKGGIKTDRETLAESGDELLVRFAETGENETLWKTFVPTLVLGTRVPINPETNVLVATGRVSYRRPNLTNQPRVGGIRECYIPRPGHLFGSIDYATLELCTLAQTNILWQGKSTMAEAINSGKDLHLMMAAKLLGLDYDEAKRRSKAKDATVKTFRQASKAINFGFPGGLGAASFVAFARATYDVKLCQLMGTAPKCGERMHTDPRSGRKVCADCFEVGKKLKAEYLLAWPEMPGYFELIGEVSEGPSGGALVIPGPPGVGPGLTRGGCRFTEAANAPFQGLAARGAKAALYAVSRECYLDRKSALWGSRVVVFIHDELLLCLPEAGAAEAAQRASSIMVSEMRRYTPDVAIKAEPALMRRWYKGAEPVYKGGTLVPWEPECHS